MAVKKTDLRRARTGCRRSRRLGGSPPSATSGPQASLSRLLAGCTITPLDERIARAAGTLCGRARSHEVVDASVVVLAQMLDASVVTGDATDLRRLAEAADYAISHHEI